MKASFDSSAVAFYIYKDAASRRRVKETKSGISGDLMVDYDKHGKPIGLEIILYRHGSAVPYALLEEAATILRVALLARAEEE